MLKLVTQIKETTQLKWNRVGRFKPSVQIHIELGSYVVRTADSVDDLLKIFRLRHEVFHREFREIAKPGLDIDRFDRAFDHLIIYHKPSDKIVGTYRLRTSDVVHSSYTALEFRLRGLYKIPGPYLELGRACVHKEHRKGSVMWLAGTTFVFTVGELYLSPIGLSLVVQIAPKPIVSTMMGMWYMSSFFGNYLTGYIGTFYEVMPKDQFFMMLFGLGAVAGLCFFALSRPMNKVILAAETAA